MAYLACVHVKSNASRELLLPDPKLTTPAIRPRQYAEDLIRIKELGVLKTLATTPLGMLVCHGHYSRLGNGADGTREMQERMGDISQYKPQSEVLHSWKKGTGLPWDPFESCAEHAQREVVCPKCGVLVAAR